ncbi:COG4315 family predicted lipoprotein [Streptomyces corynorhini]|uniref:Lipoprotein n=1 Tax=Streptomyces corynorhini TaxID=2282652 RepID=A0A370BD62_9ACTN|nr:hypothetical protein [Streptomyces corynorhini]RDG38329.1 hypothetical protein DVH02_09755 [Streptomyces corynorhini]
MKVNTRTLGALAVAALCATAVAGCSDSGGGASASKSEVPADYAAASASASVSPSAGTSSPAAKHGTVSAKTVEPYGEILVNHRDRTLYIFEADKADKSSCSGNCEKVWRPLLVKNKPAAGTGGVKADLLGTTTRGDGTKQVTYDSHPLYTYREDHRAGEAHGQDKTQFGAKWYVIDTEGKPVTTPPPSPSASPSSSASTSTGPSESASTGASTGASPSASY